VSDPVTVSTTHAERGVPDVLDPPPVSSSTASDSTVPDFTELVERYKKRVYYLALDLTGNHHDAEDLSQEVFIKAHRALDSFRGDAKVFTWLYRIAVSTHLNTQRKKAVRYMKLTDDFTHTTTGPGELPDPDERAEREQMQADIEALQALTAASMQDASVPDYVYQIRNDSSAYLCSLAR
jgi:RNA polymerase sigma-70 factor (ECF subfamily)